MIPSASDIIFNGLAGPTHNFGGLSQGNIASEANKQSPSNPRTAALEGLEMMMTLFKLGIPQAVLPPHERPHIPTLRRLGFSGKDSDVLVDCVKKSPELLPYISSSSFMWAANSGTFTPSRDSLDGKVHISISNLVTKFHRAIEPPFTFQIFNKIFHNTQNFVIHPYLPTVKQFSDEGSANYCYFCHPKDSRGVHLFVFGYSAFKQNLFLPAHYPPRQTLEASQAIVRRHKLFENCIVYAQQHPKAIDAGVFHNDVISTSNHSLFLFHEEAFIDTGYVIDQLKSKLEEVCESELIAVKASSDQITLDEAVSTYIFNSQILTLPDKNMIILAPQECEENQKTHFFLQELVQNPTLPINNVIYLNLKESMRNGGGPACLRIRVRLNDNELAGCHQGIFFNEIRYIQLKEWIEKYFREHLTPEDLGDPNLLKESQSALDELTKILKLGSIYSFQKA